MHNIIVQKLIFLSVIENILNESIMDVPTLLKKNQQLYMVHKETKIYSRYNDRHVVHPNQTN